MPVALLLLSLVAAITCGTAAWVTAGFWWGLAAYSGAGAITLLVLGAVQVAGSSRSASGSLPNSEGEILT